MGHSPAGKGPRNQTLSGQASTGGRGAQDEERESLTARMPLCREVKPNLEEVVSQKWAACHLFPDQIHAIGKGRPLQ